VLLQRHRHHAITKEVALRGFFHEWKQSVDVGNIRADNLVVGDETGCVELGYRQNVYKPKIARRSEAQSTGQTAMCTMFAASTAAGKTISPFFIIHGAGDLTNPSTQKVVDDILQTDPSVAFAFNSNSCSMSTSLFAQYATFLRQRMDELSQTGEVFFLIDGPSIHVNTEVFEAYMAENISLIFYPPNCTALLQVLITTLR
jgi:hypothetical protein